MAETTKSKNAKEKAPLIFGKMAAMMKDVEKIKKDRDNPAQHYKFRGIDDVYNSLHDIFAKHGVFTVPVVIDAKHEERKSKSGGVLIYRIYTIKYVFYAEDGSNIEAVVMGEGMDSGDKAGNKALSVAHKYALLQMLMIPTDDPKDSEVDSPEVTGEPKQISDDPLNQAVYEGEEKKFEEDRKKSYKNITIKHIDGKTYKIDKFQALDLFGKMKDAIGDEAYYRILGESGYEKSNQIPPKQIPKVYAAMVDAYKG